MKNLKYINSLGVVLVLAACLFSSCVDKNDWEVDSSYDRLFSTTSLGVTPGFTDAEVSWVKTPGVEYAIIEVSTDSLYDEIAIEETSNYRVFGTDQSITKSPHTITGLDSNTKYFLRLRFMSETRPASRWTYLEKFSFKTKVEQLISETVPSAYQILVKWPANSEVTHFEVVSGSSPATRRDITPEEKALGEAAITGLTPDTKYTITLYNNDAIRGVTTANTTPDYPFSTIIKMVEGDDINLILEGITNNEAEVVIEIPNGIYFEFNKNSADKPITIPENIKSVIFWGKDGGERPTIKLNTSIGAVGTKEIIKFYNLNVEGNGQYLFNQQDINAVIESVSVENCIINGAKCVIRAKNSIGSIEEAIINNCWIKNNTDAVFTVKEATGITVGEMMLLNSTVENVTGRYFYGAAGNPIKATVENATLYNINPANRFFDPGDNLNTSSLTVRNCIFAQPKAAGSFKLTQANNIRNVENSYITNDFTSDSTVGGVTVYNGIANDLFVDPENGDFRIKDPLFTATAGDPRWLN